MHSDHSDHAVPCFGPLRRLHRGNSALLSRETVRAADHNTDPRHLLGLFLRDDIKSPSQACALSRSGIEVQNAAIEGSSVQDMRELLEGLIGPGKLGLSSPATTTGLAINTPHPNAMLSSDPGHPGAMDRDATGFLWNVPVADRPGDTHRLFWTQWIAPFYEYGSRCTVYQHGNCWGNTILRTSYDDDDKFARAVAAVRRLAMVPIELDFEARGT